MSFMIDKHYIWYRKIDIEFEVKVAKRNHFLNFIFNF